MVIVKNHLILGLIVITCAACGVRGALTVNPPAIKGVGAGVISVPVDLRANPATHVLYGVDAKTIIIPNLTLP